MLHGDGGDPEVVPGSNSWAVAGSHTADGKALLANDMHLGISVPNTWYRVSLAFPGADGERRITGVTLPGAPFVVAGSNGRVAWGFTNSEGDWADLVVLDPLHPVRGVLGRNGHRQWRGLASKAEIDVPPGLRAFREGFGRLLEDLLLQGGVDLREQRQDVVLLVAHRDDDRPDLVDAVARQLKAFTPRTISTRSRLLAETPLRYRRQLLNLKQEFARIGSTVLLLDDKMTQAGVAADPHVMSLSHGVIEMEQLSPDYGMSRRRLRVIKLRGSTFREGWHDYAILGGGLRVFPRLIAAEHHAEFKRQPAPSGVKELDSLLGGGLDRGTTTMLLGAAGTGNGSPPGTKTA